MPSCIDRTPSTSFAASEADAFKHAVHFKGSAGPVRIGGILCSPVVKVGHFVRKAFSFKKTSNSSVNAQLGRDVLDKSSSRPSDITSTLLNANGGQRVLELSGSSQQLLHQHAQANGDWTLIPSFFWVAQHVSSPRIGGNLAPRTAAELTDTLKAHQPNVLANPDGVRAGLVEWLESRGLRMGRSASEAPQLIERNARTPEFAPWPRDLAPAQVDLLDIMIREVFRSDKEGYRVITLHGKDPEALNGTQKQHTIAIWPGDLEKTRQSACSIQRSVNSSSPTGKSSSNGWGGRSPDWPVIRVITMRLILALFVKRATPLRPAALVSRYSTH